MQAAGPVSHHPLYAAAGPLVYTCLNTIMERTIYTLSCPDSTLERIWYYVNYSGVKDFDMYRARISRSSVAWCVEVPDSKQGSLFLVQYNEYLHAAGSLYY